jgi:hypothetical protein
VTAIVGRRGAKGGNGGSEGARWCRDTEDNSGVYRGELAEDNEGSSSQRSNWSLGGKFVGTYDCVLWFTRLSLALS